MSIIWRVYLLGGLSIQREGNSPVPINLKKPNLLLARLAFDMGKSISRFELVEMLWPDAVGNSGLHSLSVALDSLRHMLEPPGVEPRSVLHADRLGVRLNPESVATDLFDFRAAIEAARVVTSEAEYFSLMDRAFALYSGELLPQVDNAWVFVERQNVSIQLLSEFPVYIERLRAAGRSKEALRHALSAAAQSPDDEALYGLVIAVLLDLGRVDEAINYFKALCTHLVSSGQGTPSRSVLRLMAPHSGKLREIAAATPRPLQQPGPPSGLVDQARIAGTQRHTAGIPNYLNEFFGREDELRQLSTMLNPAEPDRPDLLAPGSARLVTITGLGGSGKTRLATAAARLLSLAFDGHVLFVPAGGCTRSDDVVHAIAGAMRLASTEQPSARLISAKLRQYPCLLVLDNCERVSGCGRVVNALLQGCASLKILATSRVPIRLAGERVLALPALSVPRGAISHAALCEFPSAQLFASRAQEAWAEFRITIENASEVAAIVERLEGVPLAIELVAARALLLSPSQMLAELSNRFELLVAPSPGDSNHKALTHTINWSYRHLSARGKRFFAALSVFRGGFTLEAVRAVTTSPNALDLIQQVAEHSLVVTAHSGHANRYSMLESLRAYAAMRLDAAVREELHKRHATYYLSLLNEVVPKLNTRARSDALDVLDEEHANIQAAIGNVQGQPDEVRLVAATWRYWYSRAQVGLGTRLIGQALRPEATGTPEYAEALHGYGVLLDLQDDLQTAERALNDSLVLTAGHDGSALAHARTLNSLALLKDKRREHRDARDICLRAISIIREHGDAWDIAGCLNTLAGLHWHSADLDAADACFAEALSRFESLEDWPNAALIRFNIGCIASSRGDLSKARAAFELGLEQFREMSNPMWVASALHNLGDTVAGQGDESTARLYLLEALSTRYDLGDHSGMASTIEKLAEIAHNAGDTTFAIRLAAGAAAVRKQHGTPIATGGRRAYDAVIGSYRVAVSNIDFEAAWMFGSELALGALVLYAKERRLIPSRS